MAPWGKAFNWLFGSEGEPSEKNPSQEKISSEVTEPKVKAKEAKTSEEQQVKKSAPEEKKKAEKGSREVKKPLQIPIKPKEEEAKDSKPYDPGPPMRPVSLMDPEVWNAFEFQRTYQKVTLQLRDQEGFDILRAEDLYDLNTPVVPENIPYSIQQIHTEYSTDGNITVKYVDPTTRKNRVEKVQVDLLEKKLRNIKKMWDLQK